MRLRECKIGMKVRVKNKADVEYFKIGIIDEIFSSGMMAYNINVKFRVKVDNGTTSHAKGGNYLASNARELEKV